MWPCGRAIENTCCPAGTGFRPPAKFGTPARRAIPPMRRAFRFHGGGVIGFFCPAGTEFRPPAKFGTPARRELALRARSSTPDRRLGRLRGVRQGGAGYGATPPSRPPLHPPRSTPKRGFQLPWPGEGTRHTLRELPSLAALAQVISLRDA